MNTHLIVPRRHVRRAAPPASLFDRDPFASFDRLFGALSSGPRADFAPAVDVEDRDGEIRLTAELPGLEDGDFEVLVEESVVTIKGEKRSERSSDDAGFRRVERTHGSFERRFDLGWPLDPDSVKASYKHGVLEIAIPKPAAEQSAVRTIPVASAN